MAVLIDSNLLLLWIVGATDPDGVTRHKRLKAYRPSDLPLLRATVERLGTPLLLPNTATEAANLLGDNTAAMRAMPAILAGLDERYVASRDAMQQREFRWLGLTDTAILLTIGRADWLVTVDVKLHLAASHRGLNSINFNHLRFG